MNYTRPLQTILLAELTRPVPVIHVMICKGTLFYTGGPPVFMLAQQPPVC